MKKKKKKKKKKYRLSLCRLSRKKKIFINNIHTLLLIANYH